MYIQLPEEEVAMARADGVDITQAAVAATAM
jgi:hypothetical protein